MFVYSREPGTAAFSLTDRVPESVALDRAGEIADIQGSVTFGLLSEQRGKRHRILVDRTVEKDVEELGGYSYAGRYYGQAFEIDGEVYLDAVGLAVGQFVEARITGANAFDLEAEVADTQRP